jgi:endoribonuclease Dicer
MGYLVPSIMHKIDEFLLVKQLNAKYLDHCVRDDLLIMATSSPLAGNDYNYERLELLGISIIFYIDSPYLMHPKVTPSSSISPVHTYLYKTSMAPKANYIRRGRDS